MSTHALGARIAPPIRLPAAAGRQLPWIGAGLATGFLIPFVFADRLGLPRDLYYAVYAVAVVGFFTAWARATGRPLGELLRRRRRLAVVLGLALAAVLAFMAVQAEGAGDRPGGGALVGALLWRGVGYGLVDGLLLSSFPILAVFAAFEGTRLRGRRRGKLLVGAVALLASLAMTAAYHAGYSDFRSGKLKSPLMGDVMWSVPTLVTLNPIGAPIAHAGLHVTAVLHDSDSELFLPPHR
jgi:hypothetical protein